MLYISRRIGYSLYGVFDTDDGVEQTINRYDLWRACNKVDIAGVLLHNGKLYDIAPYQSDLYRTAHRDKVNVLGHVDVTLWRNCITNISFDPGAIFHPVIIRLSDFGKEVSAGVLLNVPPCDSNKLTILLDDFVKFDEYSFGAHGMRMRVEYSGIQFDLRELSSLDKALVIYNCLAIGLGDKFAVKKHVIDSVDRMERWFHSNDCMDF